MTFVDYETGSSTGQPVELYRFIGTYNSYFLTSHLDDITSDGQLYQSEPISRSKLKVGTQEESELTLEISMQFDHPLIEEYAYGNAPPRLRFELLKAHLQDVNDTVVMWSGLVQAFSVEGRIAKMRVPSVFSYTLSGSVPSARYQAPCNHVLYDQRCGVSEAANRHTTTITSISANVVTVADLPFGSNQCNAGVIANEFGEARMINNQTGTSLVLTYPFSSLSVGQTVTITRGCDHSLETCRTKFANETRYGGFPLVPAVNPFQSNIKSGG